jgi:hypothetical protein
MPGGVGLAVKNRLPDLSTTSMCPKKIPFGSPKRHRCKRFKNMQFNRAFYLNS